MRVFLFIFLVIWMAIVPNMRAIARTEVSNTDGTRLQINLNQDGALLLEGTEISPEQLTVISRISLKLNSKMRLHLRAPKTCKIVHIKNAVKAAAEGGLTNVIFGTLPISGK